LGANLNSLQTVAGSRVFRTCEGGVCVQESPAVANNLLRNVYASIARFLYE